MWVWEEKEYEKHVLLENIKGKNQSSENDVFLWYTISWENKWYTATDIYLKDNDLLLSETLIFQ
jgi:hypothetical protein